MIALMRTLSRAVRSGLKPTPSSMNGRHPPAHPDSPGVGLVDPGQALHESGLAAAVAADDAEELAALDLHGDVAERAQLLDLPLAEGVQRTLLERVDLLVGEAERLRDAAHRHGDV